MLWNALSKVIAWLPWDWLAAPSFVLAWFVGSVLRIRRSTAIAALHQAGVTHPQRVATGVYRSLARVVFEFLWMAGHPRRSLDSELEIDPAEWQRIQDLIALGRGLVVATAHTGNWDLLGCAIASKVPLTVVTRHLSWHSLDRFWQRSRSSRGLRLVDAKGAVRAATAALSSGGAVAFIVDQAPERNRGVIVADFLGRPASHDLTFALLALRCHAPVVLALDERLPGGRHRLRIPLILEPPERSSRQWAITACLQVNEALERFVRKQPTQWLWLHRRWKGVLEPSRAAGAT